MFQNFQIAKLNILNLILLEIGFIFNEANQFIVNNFLVDNSFLVFGKKSFKLKNLVSYVNKKKPNLHLDLAF